MERLWAPWRMEYIAVVDEEVGCFLCNAAQCEESAMKDIYVLWRTDNWVVVMNKWPYNNGHLLIAPKKHVSDVGMLKDTDFVEFGKMLQFSKERLSEEMNPDGFNVGLNLGRVAGAGVDDHLHWHILPRWNGDTNFMPVLSSTKVIPQSLHDLYDLLKQDDAGDCL